MLLKRRLVGRQMSALDALNDSTWQRHLAERMYKQIKNVMKYKLYTNALLF